MPSTHRPAALGARTEVVCTECGQITTIPFVPCNGNSVYCSSCFEAARLKAAAGVA